MSADKHTDSKRTLQNIANISHLKTDPFGQNISGARAFKRTERIVIVVYMLTNSVPHEEPIRVRIREHVHRLLSTVLELRLGLRAAGDERIGAISAHARELISLIWTLYVAGHISRHNAEIVIQAIDDLEQFVRSARSSYLSEHVTLSRDDLMPAPESVSRQAVDNERERKISNAPKKTSGVASKGQDVHYKGNNRQDSILDILRQSGELGIKDISSQIVDCSEKTVQRELAALIKKGLIQKKGKKRWSTYAVV